ncbi:MAG: hypothetical protein HY513_00585 [Candidatus Aenigmarchaeota archaeon]|nr:hypothetical protein [Candidatus Aenigmarchaeota archaeon]
MFFSHKKESKKPLDPADVQKLTSKGMSDKEIIKHFKSKGYSYDEIEKAMMTAVRENITEAPAPQQIMETPEPESFFYEEAQPPAAEEVYMEEPSESLVEEIVEGLIEDKWQKLAAEMDRMQSEIDKMAAEIKQVKNMPVSQAKEVQKIDDFRVNEISEHLNDLDARVGGLEKAFKQFLPALTKNIEMLSTMVHEMKTGRAHEAGDPYNSVRV